MTETRSFAFPLNVYARILELHGGRVDHLHYGMFERADEPVYRAQQRASEMLWDALPGPCRLLDVGIGLGTTLARLAAEGYQARGITPDPEQAAAARRRYPDGVDVDVSTLQDYARDAGRWQALLFQESAQYIDPAALFDAADRLLTPEGSTLIVMDEFLLRSDARQPDLHLHDLRAFCALAASRGWQLARQLDLSARALPTLDFLLANLDAEADRLVDELDLSVADLEALAQSNRRYRQLYAEGTYGYALLRFERRPAPDVVRWLAGNDAGAVRTLFAQVFGKSMSAEHWAWKYGDGRGQAVGVFNGNELQAHYGGITREISYFGKPALACQICDVMVAPQCRSGLARRGPMVRLGETFLDAQLGFERRHLVGFGFPNRRAYGVAARAGLYAAVDEIVRFGWAARRVESAQRTVDLQAADLGEGGRYRRAVDRLWQGMAANLQHAVVCKRDAAWVLRRYFDRAEIRYDVVLMRSRWTRRPLGLVILRRHERHLEVLDLVAAPHAFRPLIGLARRRAFDQGLERVECWITASQSSYFEAVDPAHEAVPAGITVPANVRTPGPVDELRARWFLMAGDADFT